tara:strand:+ start:16141 stop:17115 length:975 start_codon:yes stop_codon:yes gene_type:complete
LKILITGCAGFIGSSLSQMLKNHNYEILGLDNISDSYDPNIKSWRIKNILDKNDISWIKADICDFQKTKKIIHEFKPEAIINLAARAGVRQSIDNPKAYYDTNLIGNLNLLEISRDLGINKYILASTSSIYGNSKLPFDEDNYDGFSLSPYASSKKSAEDMCRVYNHLFNIDIVVLRFFTVYGPAGRPDMSMFRFVKWIIENEEIQLNGDGNQSRDFTHVSDISRAIIKSLKINNGFKTINLGSDRPVKINSVISIIEKVLNKKARIKNHPFHPTDIKKTWANIEKAKELLDWKPEISIDDGIESVINWYLDNEKIASKINLYF